MDAARFRLTLVPLEDRTTPAVSPTDVFNALAQTARTEDLLQRVAARPAYGFNIYTEASLRDLLPTLTVESQRSAAVLAEYQNELAAAAVTDPAAARAVAPVAAERYQAELNAVYAASYTATFGNAPIQTVLPTPASAPTPVAIPTVFDGTNVVVPPPVDPPTPPTGDTTTSAGLTGEFPDLDSAEFRDLGNGLRVRTLAAGTPDAADPDGFSVGTAEQLSVFYSGFLVDGRTRFESNITATPADFADGTGLIAGFQTGVAGLQPGEVRILDIPAALAYGERGSPPNIPSNARLTFEVKRVVPDTTTVTDPGIPGVDFPIA